MATRAPDWQFWFPILTSLRGYHRRALAADCTAGIIIALVTVPQAMAYAFLAGLPPVAGLYAAILPAVLYGLVGGSRYLAMGPVALIALMTMSAISGRAEPGSNDWVHLAVALSLLSGLFLLGLRMLRLGGIVSLLSQPVITGFLNAAAVLIILSQIPALVGVESGSGNLIQRIEQLVLAVPSFSPLTLLLGGGAFLLLLGIDRLTVPVLRRFFRGIRRTHPGRRLGPVVASAAGLAVVLVFNLDSHGIAVVGSVPGGLPTPFWPDLPFATWLQLAPAAVVIALVSFVETYSIGQALASRRRRRMEPDRELLAVALANLAAALSATFPVSGSFSRSGVAFAAGGRTALTGIIAALLVLLTLLFATAVFEALPQAVLAAIIIWSVLSLLNPGNLRERWRYSPHDTTAQLVTFAAVLLLGVETGLMAGILTALALMVRRSARPHITLVGRVGDSATFRSGKRHEVAMLSRVAAVRIDESLHFANIRHVENQLLRLIGERPQLQHLLLVCNSINHIDLSGLEMLERLVDSLRELGIRVHLSEVKSPVLDRLETTPFMGRLSGNIYVTTDQAFRDLATKV